MSSCPFCGEELQPDRRYTRRDALKCSSCGYQALAPGGYLESVTPLCAYEPCSTPFTPDKYNPSQRFHSRRCRQAAYRLRLRSGGVPA